MKQVHRITVAVLLGGLIYVVAPLSTSAQSACHLYESGTAAPQGFGAAWNTLTSSRELLLRVTCPDARAFITVGTGAQNQYIYKDFYRWNGSAWSPRTWSGSNLVGNFWYVGDAFGELDYNNSPDYFVAYVCQWTGSQWKCGCRDTACTTNYWQLQAFDKSHVAQGGGGGTPGGSNAPSEVKACSNPKQLTATPSNVSSVVKNAGKCSVITLEPGTYSTIRVDHADLGKVDGITIRCKNPASLSGSVCKINFVQIIGERRHRGDEQFGSVIIENLVFVGKAQQYGGGTDYGIQLYNIDAIRIANNIFNGVYNHDISTKERVLYAEVLNNRFIKCRRQCFEIGQNGNIESRPSWTETTVIRGNVYEDIIGNAITQRANRKLIVENNTFKNVGAHAVITWPYWTKYPFGDGGDDGTLYVPKPPLRTEVINNTFSGNAKLVFEGRGVNDDTVLVKGNSGSFSCSRIPMDDRTADAHGDEQTKAPPKLDPASDVSC